MIIDIFCPFYKQHKIQTTVNPFFILYCLDKKKYLTHDKTNNGRFTDWLRLTSVATLGITFFFFFTGLPYPCGRSDKVVLYTENLKFRNSSN